MVWVLFFIKRLRFSFFVFFFGRFCFFFFGSVKQKNIPKNDHQRKNKKQAKARKQRGAQSQNPVPQRVSSQSHQKRVDKIQKKRGTQRHQNQHHHEKPKQKPAGARQKSAQAFFFRKRHTTSPKKFQTKTWAAGKPIPFL